MDDEVNDDDDDDDDDDNDDDDDDNDVDNDDNNNDEDNGEYSIKNEKKTDWGNFFFLLTSIIPHVYKMRMC